MTPAGTSNELDVQNEWEENTHTQDGNGDGSGDGAGTGTGTGVGICRRTPDGNGDGNGDVSEDCSGDGNGDDDNGNENRIGEGGRGTKKRKKPQNSCRRRAGNGGDMGVCVCVFSSHPFWTSSSLDVPAGVTQEEGHTGFLIHLPSAVRALIFVARRIQPFLSLVDREVEFCVLTN